MDWFEFLISPAYDEAYEKLFFGFRSLGRRTRLSQFVPKLRSESASGSSPSFSRSSGLCSSCDICEYPG
jgi:hypothetical protein